MATRKKATLLVSKRDEKASTFSFRISPQLATRSAQVKARAEAAGLEWRIADGLALALEEQCACAERTLDSLAAQPQMQTSQAGEAHA